MNLYSFFAWLLFVHLYLINKCEGGIFSWLFTGFKKSDICSDDSDCFDSDRIAANSLEVSRPNRQIHDSIKDKEKFMYSVKIPFEISSSDEKFISELIKYSAMEISELDVCNHKVVLGLHSSCLDMSEEDISKAAVNLLNCQSAVEGRKIYPCTKDMMLHECTKEMDQTTWNAYHIMSNRVRAVCYQLRNQQFRAKTEMVVDKLVHTAEEQIGAMRLLEESQNILKHSTSETLDVVNSGYVKLQDQQKELSSAHINIHNYVSSNLRELSKEKKLIAAGQRELAVITLTIKKKIEEAQKQLLLQEAGQTSVHQKILHDLSKIQASSNKVWEQLDKSTQKIFETHEVIASNYGKLMHDLEKMNSTVQHLMNILITLRIKVEDKFNWISSLLGDTDATVQKIYFFVIHICYCILLMISASFLQVPYATRIALIVLVPLNALSEMKNDTSLPLSTLSIVLAVCMFFNISSIGIVKAYQWHKKKSGVSIHNNIQTPIKPALRHLTHVPASSSTPAPCSLNSSVQKSNINDRSTLSMDDDFSSDDEGSLSSWKKKKLINEHPSQKFNSSMANIIEEGDLGRFNGNNSYNKCDSNENIMASIRKRLQLDDDKNLRKFSSLNNSFLDSPVNKNNSIHSRTSRSSTPLSDQRYNLSRSSISKSLCSAICKSGLLCKNFSSPGNSLCFRHMSGSRESSPAIY